MKMVSRHIARAPRRAVSTAAILGVILSGPIIGASGEFTKMHGLNEFGGVKIKWVDSSPEKKHRRILCKYHKMMCRLSDELHSSLK